MSKEIKDICNEDNILQNKLKNKEISQAKYDFLICKLNKVHKDYTIATSENEFLKKLIQKHGGN